MRQDLYDDQDISIRSLGRVAPATAWGFVMAAAVVCAAVTVWRAPAGSQTRLVATLDGAAVDALGREVKRIGAERDELAQRLARLERGVGEMRIAMAAAPETTGSIGAPTPQAASGRPAAFAIAFGPEATVEAARRRWNALAGRYPRALSALAARTVKRGSTSGAVELIAGPFATAADAARACADLLADGVPCDTTAYTGEPIGRS
ncbi:SPOR domain-containing protein [Methylopila henanensis]|uniref:SPOR domain-containing protein n=1 Tax=Methylopila henanensis TaxID=873516 RepID=A0ABW4KB13_9HYPH